jgi:hypothetical protein
MTSKMTSGRSTLGSMVLTCRRSWTRLGGSGTASSRSTRSLPRSSMLTELLAAIVAQPLPPVAGSTCPPGRYSHPYKLEFFQRCGFFANSDRAESRLPGHSYSSTNADTVTPATKPRRANSSSVASVAPLSRFDRTPT